jgi:hypothetical protein
MSWVAVRVRWAWSAKPASKAARAIGLTGRLTIAARSRCHIRSRAGADPVGCRPSPLLSRVGCVGACSSSRGERSAGMRNRFVNAAFSWPPLNSHLCDQAEHHQHTHAEKQVPIAV